MRRLGSWPGLLREALQSLEGQALRRSVSFQGWRIRVWGQCSGFKAEGLKGSGYEIRVV